MTFGGLNTGAADATYVSATSTTSQLPSYVASARAASHAGNKSPAQSYLASFVAYVQGHSGVTITAAYAVLLVGWANDLGARL